MARNQSSGENAREKARRIQQEQQRRQRGASVLLRVGVVVVALVVVAGLTFFVLNRQGDGEDFSASEGAAPAIANEQGGITLTSAAELADGADMGEVDASEVPGAGESEAPVPGAEPREEGEKPHVIIYADANCVHCSNFETSQGQQIQQWLEDGDITVEYRMVGMLDGNSTTNYSSRAANAITAMAVESPENYLPYLEQVLAHQPEGELSNDELISIAQDDYGVDLSGPVEDNTYRAFVTYTTNQAAEVGVQGTPTIYIGDQNWQDSEQAFGEWAGGFVEEYRSETGDGSGGDSAESSSEE
ncbi:thioredoxin domain-containing protein [Nesterenkonia sp. F]|uniref:DsbA family protein n=1 Tax=Nesterenkonia sp. F TaxID=795955 RepID=UPI000255CB41|nr:thioredoxin domain-containing protein [Nesterenkonia sp. F]